MVVCAGCNQSIERGLWEMHALKCALPREDKLWSELSKADKAEEKREFLEGYAHECGGKPSDYQMEWESYLNQEGYTFRDERILVERMRGARGRARKSVEKHQDDITDVEEFLSEIEKVFP